MVEKIGKLLKACKVPLTCECCNAEPIAASITSEDGTPMVWIGVKCAELESKAAERGFYQHPGDHE